MTSEQLYYRAALQVSKLGTGVGQLLEPAMFVALYNAAQTNWWKQALPTRTDSVFRDQLESLLHIDAELTVFSTTDRATIFTQPARCYQVESLQVQAKQNATQCVRWLTGLARTNAWINQNWANPLANPSFEWEETLYTMASGKLVVFRTDFSLDKARITYYQDPLPIDIAGYERLDGTSSETINSTLPDELQEEILQIMLSQLPI